MSLRLDSTLIGEITLLLPQYKPGASGGSIITGQEHNSGQGNDKDLFLTKLQSSSSESSSPPGLTLVLKGL